MTSIPPNDPLRISLDEVAQQLQDAILDSDNFLTVSFEGLARLEDVKSKILTREKLRVARSFGTDDPRVNDLQTEIKANVKLVATLRFEHDKASVISPPPDKSGYMLHGFVRAPDLAPVKEITAALYTAQGELMRQAGFAFTDSLGYFKLLVPTPLPKVTTAPAREPIVTDETARATPALTPAPEPTADLARIYLCLHDKKQKFLFRDPTTLTPEAGGVEYREIILGTERSVGTPPPAKSRLE
jgi:hypothetical protein